MGEATLEDLKDQIETAFQIARQLKGATPLTPSGAPTWDPRALALVATKLEEAELWLTKVRT